MATIKTGSTDHLHIELVSESILQHSRLTVVQGRDDEREAVMAVLGEALERVYRLLYPPREEKS